MPPGPQPGRFLNTVPLAPASSRAQKKQESSLPRGPGAQLAQRGQGGTILQRCPRPAPQLESGCSPGPGQEECCAGHRPFPRTTLPSRGSQLGKEPWEFLLPPSQVFWVSQGSSGRQQNELYTALRHNLLEEIKKAEGKVQQPCPRLGRSQNSRDPGHWQPNACFPEHCFTLAQRLPASQLSVSRRRDLVVPAWSGHPFLSSISWGTGLNNQDISSS